MSCDSVASPMALPQLGPRDPNLAAAAMHAVLRVAAAEDVSRQYCCLHTSDLSSRSAEWNRQQADSFGSASFGHVYALPELTRLQPGKGMGCQGLRSACQSAAAHDDTARLVHTISIA